MSEHTGENQGTGSTGADPQGGTPPPNPPQNTPAPKAPPASDPKQPDTGPETDWQAEAKKAAADAEKWRTLARKHEERAKSNAEGAAKAKTVEQQLEELRKAMADRDTADIARAGRLAMTQVQANLASHGFSKADVAGLLELIDPVTLLTDGEPDDAAIEKLTKSLVKIGGRATPDPDQGRKGGESPTDMNALLRKAVGR